MGANEFGPASAASAQLTQAWPFFDFALPSAALDLVYRLQIHAAWAD